MDREQTVPIKMSREFFFHAFVKFFQDSDKILF